MKHRGLLFTLMLLTGLLQAQTPDSAKTDTTWRFAGLFGLGATQTSFINWAAGGENALGLAALANAQAGFKRGRLQWDNTLDLGYGLQKVGDDPFRKTDDRIDLLSKLGYGLVQGERPLLASLRLNFRSQFANGFNLPNDSVVASHFMAPGYLFLSLGLDWKPFPWLSLSLAPLSAGKITFVLDQDLANAGAFGVEAAVRDSATGQVREEGRRVRYEFGALFSALAQHKWKWGSLQSRLDLFNNFTDPVPNQRANVDVTWETILGFNLNKIFSITVAAQMLYDHDTKVPIFEDVNGVETQTGAGPRTQFRSVLSIGLAYKFKDYIIR